MKWETKYSDPMASTMPSAKRTTGIPGNTGVVMFEDGWPIQLDSWYGEDFNDVVFEYDLKVTECHSQQMMETVGGKEELLLTLDVRAVGGKSSASDSSRIS